MKKRYLVLILIVALIFIAGCGIVNKSIEEGERNQENIKAFISNETEQGQIKEEAALEEISKPEPAKISEGEPRIPEERVAEDEAEKIDIAGPAEGGDYIAITSFNIQVFGQSKISNPEIMNILSRIVKRYDVVAIQEVRSTEQNVIPALLNLVNDEDTKYSYIISERLGRTASKEQYAFVYNTKTISLIPNSSYVVADSDDVFEREPFVAYFRSRNFDFKIVNNHIKPEDVEAELRQLAVVINSIYDSSSEKDIIVLGDMNADGSYFNENKLTTILPLWIQLIGNEQDTTVAVGNNTYDRMMTRDTTANVEYTGTSGVFRWDNEYGVTNLSFVKKVSDHYPIYAEFRTDLPDDD